MTIAIYVHIYCTNVPGNSFLSKYFFFEKHNEINIKLEKNKKSHLSPANDLIDITYDHYDPFIHHVPTSRGLHSHEHAKIFQHAKKKIKVVSEVSIWINHNFSHEFNDDVNEWSAVQWKINIITEHQNIGTLADNYM